VMLVLVWMARRTRRRLFGEREALIPAAMPIEADE
jgi:hypothetical protein